MQIVVLATEWQKAELSKEEKEGLIWIQHHQDFPAFATSDAFLDLTYVNTKERNNILTQLLPKPVIISSVADTIAETHPSFIRINGWTTFLSTSVLEAAALDENTKEKAEEVFSFFSKKLAWMADEPGFIVARVISMIINEAYLALAEGVSTKEEIDTAMKLGTAYPFGPFEWAEKIGLKNIVECLQKLSQTQARYSPAPGLVKEAG